MGHLLHHMGLGPLALEMASSFLSITHIINMFLLVNIKGN